MPRVEHHIEVTEMPEGAKPDVEALAVQLRGLANEGWELVSTNFGIDLERFGRCDLLLFKRIASPEDSEPDS